MADPVTSIRRLMAIPRGKPIRAFHGSPHSFSRFDASKIGTGEGAQAFGHGLYFAGSEDTADFYRRKLAEDGDAPERWARDYWAAQAEPDAIGSPQDAYDYLLSHIRAIRNAGPGSGYSPGLKRHYAAAEKWLLSQSPFTVPDPIRQGHMYEVEIDYPEEALLDWDGSVMPAGHAVSEAGWGRGISTGRDLWQAAARDMGSLGASLHFSRGGIPGIRYLDHGSRAAGKGTRNYVMFPGTEDRIRILRQYGLIPPMAAGLMQDEEQ